MLPVWQQWKPGWSPGWQGGQSPGIPGLIPWDVLTFTRAGSKFKDNGDGTVTLAAANTPIIDSRGLLIEPAITNQMVPSQDFAVWVASDATVTPHAITAPDGTLTADILTASQNTVSGGATAQLYQGFSATVGQQCTLSVWAKAGTFNKLDIACNNGATVTHFSFNLTSQWQRFSATFTAQAAFIYAEVGWLDTYSVAGKNVQIWGYQAEAGPVMHSYVVSVSPVAGTCPKDVAYFSGLSIPSASRISVNATPRAAWPDGNYHFLFDSRDRVTGIGGCALFVEPSGAMTARIQDTGVDVTLFSSAVLPWVALQTYAVSLVQDGLGNASIIRDGVTVGSATAQRILPVATFLTVGAASDSTLPIDGWIASPALRPALTPF